MNTRFPSNDDFPTKKQIRSLLKSDIQNDPTEGWTSSGELETNIGRWVHLGQIFLTVHHFFSRLRFLKQRAEKWRSVDINEQCQADLNFLRFILQQC
jgi:hypothetical protein